MRAAPGRRWRPARWVRGRPSPARPRRRAGTRSTRSRRVRPSARWPARPCPSARPSRAASSAPPDRPPAALSAGMGPGRGRRPAPPPVPARPAPGPPRKPPSTACALVYALDPFCLPVSTPLCACMITGSVHQRRPVSLLRGNVYSGEEAWGRDFYFRRHHRKVTPTSLTCVCHRPLGTQPVEQRRLPVIADEDITVY